VGIARVQMEEAKHEKRFWAESLNHAATVKNLWPVPNHDLTPSEAWDDKRPDIKYLIPYGTIVFYKNNKKGQDKWENKGRKASFLGLVKGRRGVRVYDTELKKVILTRDIKIHYGAFMDDG